MTALCARAPQEADQTEEGPESRNSNKQKEILGAEAEFHYKRISAVLSASLILDVDVGFVFNSNVVQDKTT